MPLQIIKQLAIVEDIEFGHGTVDQLRDINGDGIPTLETYNKVNAGYVPALDTTLNGSTVQAELDARLTELDSDTRYAKLAGDSVQVFSAAGPTTATEVVPRGYLETYVTSQIANYALKTDVLTKSNLIAYTPISAYHPSTKKYVDDTVINIGSGDMAKGIYDTNNSGTVDDSDKLGGLVKNMFMHYQGVGTDANLHTTIGYWDIVTGLNVPTPAKGILSVKDATPSFVLQEFHVVVTDDLYVRSFDGVVWTTWESASSQLYIQDDLNGTTNPNAVLGADQGRVLAEMVTAVSSTVAPVGSIMMWGGVIASLPANWALCDGSNNTPNLNNMFIMGTISQSQIGVKGGTLASTMPSHTHAGPSHTHSINHNHPVNSTSAAGAHLHTVLGAQYTLNTGGSGINYSIMQSTGNNNTNTTGSHSHTYSVGYHYGNAGWAGGTTGAASVPGDNRPPFYTLAYIQRIS